MPGGRPRKKQRKAAAERFWFETKLLSPHKSIPGMSDKENLHVEGTHDCLPSPDHDIFTRETELIRDSYSNK